jgi:hypothetical protein
MSNLTLGQLTYRVAREVTEVLEGTATGGNTTTIVDNPIRDEPDDYWNSGTAWILRDAGGAGAAPEGEFSVISDHVASTWTMTLRSTLTAAVASGDRYAVCRKAGDEPWLDIIIQKINGALLDLGPVPYTDTTSITTAANQTEYSLPIAANQDLRQVWIQNRLSDTNDNQWTRYHDYYIQASAVGSSDLLVFNAQPDSGYAVKLIYVATHPEMYTAASQLSEHVNEKLVIYPAVRDCFLWWKQYTGFDKWDDQIARWEERVEMVKLEGRTILPSRTNKMLIIPRRGDKSQQAGDVNLVRL